MVIAICDDDILFTEQLLTYLKAFFKRNNLPCPNFLVFNSGEALLANTDKKDIVFLDIEMPGLSGISTGQELKKQNSKIIIFIVTSYAEYLDEAMRFHVFRYLSKPLEKHRLFRNMKDALHVYSTENCNVPIELRHSVHTVSVSDIICLEVTTDIPLFTQLHRIMNPYILLPSGKKSYLLAVFFNPTVVLL